MINHQIFVEMLNNISLLIKYLPVRIVEIIRDPEKLTVA